GAGQVHTFVVTDKAGNTALLSMMVSLDKTAPMLSAQRDTAANAYGWNNTNVSASYSASDTLSGMGSAASGAYVFSGEGMNQSHTFSVTDLAGNLATFTVGGVNIDKTAPVLVA